MPDITDAGMTDLHPALYYAERYPLSLSTLYSAMQEGLLPYYRVPSRRGARGKYLIREADFLAWLASLRVEGALVDEGRLRHLN